MKRILKTADFLQWMPFFVFYFALFQVV